MELNKEFPSLKLVYESILDTLKEQTEISRDYVNRAITLFSVGTAVIGIGLPLLFTKHFSDLKIFKTLPFVDLFFIPILLYIGVIVFFRLVCNNEYLETVNSPTIVKDDYLELEPDIFYSEMIQNIEESFKKNEVVIKNKEKALTSLIGFTIAEVLMVIIPAILFFTFRGG